MKTIAIAAGGDSSEYEISVKSANEVGKILSSKYAVYIITIHGTNLVLGRSERSLSQY
jgi:D-alanine-D-alanine ligase-like ATP-grasp enzyme